MELKRFFSISSLTGRYRALNFRENRVNSVDLIHFFSEFFTKISPTLIKSNKIFYEKVVDITFKEKIHCRLFAMIFCHKFWLKISQNSDFFIKNGTK